VNGGKWGEWMRREKSGLFCKRINGRCADCIEEKKEEREILGEWGGRREENLKWCYFCMMGQKLYISKKK
jgi:hypothetical protein